MGGQEQRGVDRSAGSKERLAAIHRRGRGTGARRGATRAGDCGREESGARFVFTATGDRDLV